MQFNVPSLHNIALLKIATSLWNESNILHDVFDDSPFHLAEEKVATNAQRLKLPQPFKEKIIVLTKLVGEQIDLWLKPSYHCEIEHPKIPYMFCWTLRGTIDRQATVRTLILNEKIDLIDRYVLACYYCLEPEIRILWNGIDTDKEDYNNLADKALSNQIVIFWTLQMISNQTSLPCFNRSKWIFDRKYTLRYSCSLFMLKQAHLYRNPAAIKYFWQKLSIQEKVYCFARIELQNFCYNGIYELYPIFNYTDTYYFLFCRMGEERQKTALKKNSYDILFMFLSLPLQDLFLQFARHSWEFLSQRDYLRLLEEIFRRQKINYGGYSYLFNQFWMESPISFRRFMVDRNFKFLFMHLEPRDEENIILFLKDITVEEKKRILFSERGMSTCKELGTSQQWALFESFVNECLPDVQLIGNFERAFEKYITPSTFWRNAAALDEEKRCQIMKEVYFIFKKIIARDSFNES